MKTMHLIASVTISILYFNVVIAQNETLGLVSSATPEATESGAQILKKGGNAVDAAVAVAFTLGVTEPAMSGIGGRTMIILSLPNQEPIAIGGISLTPTILDSNIEKKDLTFYKQVSIPSQVKILNYVWKKYGSGQLKWEELLESAIHYAENGFINGIHRHHVFKRVQQKFIDNPYHNRELLVDNEIPAIGDLIKQPTLARTLKKLAINGGDDFYKGDVAKEIAEDFKNNGGWITFNDLSNFPEPKEHKPLHVNYRGYDVYSFIPPGGGWQVLQVLNLLEQYHVNDLKANTTERTLAILNVLNLSHNDRLDNAIKDYSNFQSEIDEKISKNYAKTLLKNANNLLKVIPNSEEKGQGETTHFSVTDKEGIAVSVTSSVGAYFGSITSTKSLGFFYNSYLKSLMGFGLGKSLEPNVSIPSSMSPSLVKKDGKNVLVIGTPGSKRIVSTISQLIQLWVDSEMSITDIINEPRVHAIRNLAYIEDENITSKNLQKIRSKRFKIAFPNYDLTNKSGLNAYFGGVHAIEYRNGQWKAAADPRRDGTTITVMNE
ncbi:gamma-glutamyltransferase [Jejuia spongiicola]|uniref:Gamma-glutamyltransferase n=1 Tax=Jejuia spongiicola TaxID=2942207 RepID=A0ABT0QAI7_9FLAO|nr:gamma-glutamyltransferase [Jejuia spongiicola]MCL6293996.1 gamma-glutamyltransferase [Jejuia spongiicola]